MSTGISIKTIVQDEGTIVPAHDVINFTGAGVTVTNVAGVANVNIPGAGPAATNYGLYAQTVDSSPITATVVEKSLIAGGVGTLTVPAYTFAQGDSFRAEFGGLMSAKNNDTLRVRIYAGSSLLADSGALTMPGISNQVWLLNINFTVRSIGGAGAASISSLANLHILKLASGSQEGFGFTTVNNTTFNTTIANTLSVTAQWSSNSALNSIYTSSFVLNKIY